jgi:hypothetical protein
MFVETTSEAVTPAGSTLHHSYSYSFICKTLVGVYIPVDSNDVGKSPVQANGIWYEISTNVTGITLPCTSVAPCSVTLSEGYPNPISHSQLASRGINFEFEIFNSGAVSLIFSMCSVEKSGLR